MLAAKELDAAAAASSSDGSSTFQERLASNAAAGSSSRGTRHSGRSSMDSSVRTAFSERSANVDASGQGSGAAKPQEAPPAVPPAHAAAKPFAVAAGRQHEGARAAGGGSSDAGIPSWRPAKHGRARAPATSRFVLGPPGRDQHSKNNGQDRMLAKTDHNLAQRPHQQPLGTTSAMQQGSAKRQPMTVQSEVRAIQQQAPSCTEPDLARCTIWTRSTCTISQSCAGWQTGHSDLRFLTHALQGGGRTSCGGVCAAQARRLRGGGCGVQQRDRAASAPLQGAVQPRVQP